MRNPLFKILALVALLPAFAHSQAIVKGGGVVYTNGAPTHSVNLNSDAEIAIDTTTGYWHERSRDGLGWILAGFRVQEFPFGTAPTAAPLDKQSEVLLNDVDSLYRWRSGAWRHLNKVWDNSPTNELQTIANTSNATTHTATLSNSGGSVQFVEGTGIGLATTGTGLDGILTITNTLPDQTVVLTQGGIVVITGTYPNFTITATEVDGSVTNEGLLGVGAGSGTSSVLLSNTSGATGVTINAAGILAISESTSANGGSITLTATEADGSITNENLTISDGTDSENLGGQTLNVTGGGIAVVDYIPGSNTLNVTATEVDGSTTNELQTLASTSDATTHTVTLSNSGGSFQLVEGSNITLTTSGTGLNGIITIASTGSGNTDLAFTGTSSPVTLNSSTGTDVTFTQGGIVTLSATGTNITITATEVDGSTSNELQTYGHAGTTTYTNTLSSGGGSWSITGAGIAVISQTAGAVTVTATEVDGSISNEGVLGVGAGSGTSSTLLSTTSGANAVTINAAGILAISESTSANGGSITLTATEVDGSVTNEAWTIDGDDAETEVISNQTVKFQGAGIAATDYDAATNVLLITATEVDGSTTNELQTLANTSGGTTHTVTLSNSGGSFQLVEGTNITLTTTGTGLDGIITIASTGSADGNGPYSGNGGNGGDGTVPSVTKSTVTNQWTVYRATDDSGGLVPFRIEVNAGNEPDFLSMKANATSDSLLFAHADVEFTITSSSSLNIGTPNGNMAILSGGTVGVSADSIQISTVPDAFANEATLLFVAPSGSIVKAEGLDPDIIRQNGATNGQVLKWNNSTSNWEPANEGAGTSDLTFSGTSSPVTLNSSTGADVTFTAGGINSFSASGTNITITATEVDGSTTNELQTIANTSNATTHTATLSNSGGSVQFAEGTGITLTTTGTGLDGVLTIAATTQATDLTFTGSGPYTLNSSTGTDVTFTQGSGIVITRTSNDLSFAAVDGSTTNELQIFTNSSDATNHYLVLSDGGGSITFAEGSGITLTTSGTSLDGVVTISATGGGSGDVLNNGNSFGAAFIVGSNDNNTVSLEQNGTTVFTIGTDKNITATNSVAATNTVTDQLKLNINSTGTAAANFGNAILFSGESSTTNDRQMARFSSYWTTATDASREAALSWQLGNNAGALAEIMKLEVATSGTGWLSIGSSTPVGISNAGILMGTAFILNNQSNVLTIGGSAGEIKHARGSASTNTVVPFRFQAETTGTAAAGLGPGISFQGETTTTAEQDMGSVNVIWTTATHASRTADMVFTLVNNAAAEAEKFRIYANGRAMVGGGTNEASAALQVTSTTGGFLGPKGTDANMTSISSPVEGLEFWNTTIKGKCVYNGTGWHRLSCAQTPTVTIGTGAGTGATASVVGTDLAGVITITMGTTPVANVTVVTLDFHTDYNIVPKAVSLTGGDEDAATQLSTNTRNWFCDKTAITVDEFIIKSGSVPSAFGSGTVLEIFYNVGQ